ncbi:MAG: prolyl aminopeptidase [Elusimicrobia bacterium]|nr:prolyl aminopeptidase [Elusimicrobiota bacterium]
MRKLYPPIKPYREGFLKVSPLHTIHYEESGNPRGKPAIFLHGGPGGGISPSYRQYFHPKKWRLILLDQRGCGKSRPHAELRENTTWDLVEDVEALRRFLGIERWVVFGGSWGSTLSLAYAEKYPQCCRGLILRGIFLLRRAELLWFYQEGASWIFPDFWEDYLRPIPPAERSDMMGAYYKRLTSPNAKIRGEAAGAWTLWEGRTSKLRQEPEHLKRFKLPSFQDAFARIECHYFVNRGFLKRDDQLLRDTRRLRAIPGVIIQGRYDIVCPMKSAWDLHCAWPKAKFVVVPDAGHTMYEPGITDALIDATDRLVNL